MAKVKLFRVHDDYEDESLVISSSVDDSDWEEITETDLILLKSYLHRQRGIVVVEKLDGQVEKELLSIRSIVEKEKKAKEERDKIQKQKALERELKRRAKTEQQEKELLVKLTKKYEGEYNG